MNEYPLGAGSHHFVVPNDGSSYSFLAGTYELELFVSILGASRDRLLWTHSLGITDEQAAKLTNPSAGIFFDWGPESKRYLAHVQMRPEKPNPEELLELLLPVQRG